MPPPPLHQTPKKAFQGVCALRFWLPRLGVLLLMLCACLGAWYLWAHNPNNERNFFVVCGFHELTNLHCLGCGSTRAGHALLHGRIGEALSQNVFFVASIPFFAWLILTRLMPWMLGKDEAKPLPVWLAKWIVWLPVLLIIFAVLRNMPWAPGPWLAPNE